MLILNNIFGKFTVGQNCILISKISHQEKLICFPEDLIGRVRGRWSDRDLLTINSAPNMATRARNVPGSTQEPGILPGVSNKGDKSQGLRSFLAVYPDA